MRSRIAEVYCGPGLSRPPWQKEEARPEEGKLLEGSRSDEMDVTDSVRTYGVNLRRSNLDPSKLPALPKKMIPIKPQTHQHIIVTLQKEEPEKKT